MVLSFASGTVRDFGQLGLTNRDGSAIQVRAIARRFDQSLTASALDWNCSWELSWHDDNPVAPPGRQPEAASIELWISGPVYPEVFERELAFAILKRPSAAQAEHRIVLVGRSFNTHNLVLCLAGRASKLLVSDIFEFYRQCGNYDIGH